MKPQFLPRELQNKLRRLVESVFLQRRSFFSEEEYEDLVNDCPIQLSFQPKYRPTVFIQVWDGCEQWRGNLVSEADLT